MALTVGDRLGPYEILAGIGAGGMGEVYRARDTRLERQVALKVIPPSRMDNPESRRRFLQEAKTASSLNHPNIVTIYDIGNDQGVDYLAMELVPGKPLSQLIPPGGFALAELLRYAMQIADGLAKAHAAGITHRDLKPANIMVTPEGAVKVLDFGLAKLHSPSSSTDVTAAATATQTMGALTEEGTVIGTAAYMSPEQAEGKPLDARSDIFSFGSMLYEMATGRRAFRGDSPLAIMAAVLRDEPPLLAELRPDSPPELARLIGRCLRKDPERRAHSMADLRVAMEELREESTSGKPALAAPERHGRSLLRLAIPFVLALAAIAGYFVWRATNSRPVASVAVQPLPLTSYPGNEFSPTFSPDGNQVAFVWTGERSDNPDIYVKLIGSGAPLRLTTDPHFDNYPRWSPDGRNIAFIRLLENDQFEVVAIPPLGGSERKMGRFYTRQIYSTPIPGLCWTPDSRYLLVAGSQTPNQPNQILRVAFDSGDVKIVAALNDGSEGYTQPAVSPDGSALALVHHHGVGSIEVLPLSKNLEAGTARRLNLAGLDARSLDWTPDGRDLVFSLVQSNPMPMYRVNVSSGVAQPLVWTGPGANFPVVARQGHRMAFSRAYRDTNIWRLSLDRNRRALGPPVQLASSTFREVYPHYSPDGKRLVFYSNRGGSVQIWTADADGSHAVQLTSMDPLAISGSPRWSPDGQYISFDSNQGGQYHIYVVKADGGQPRALTSGSFNNFVSTWSPDGRYIYFTSNRSGQLEIWRTTPAGGAAEQVTHTGAECADFSPDGKWLYFTKEGGGGGMWKLPVSGGDPVRLTGPIYRYNFAVTADGLYFMPAEGRAVNSIRFLNFATGTETEILKIEKPTDLGLAISPDGRSLLFTQIDYVGQDLMLVENFQ